MAYTGDILILNQYYIHRHKENIGKADNRNKHTNDLINNYKNQKEQAFNTSKTIFKTLLSNSINNGAKELLNTAFEDDNIMTDLNQQLQKALQESLSVDVIQRGLLIQQNSNINYNKLLNEKGKEKIKEFDKLLQVIANACKLLQSKEGSDLAAALLSLQGSAANTQTKTLGIKIQNALKQFSKTNEGMTIDQQRVQQVITYINSLGNLLIASSDSSNEKKITSKSFAAAMRTMFGSGFQEVFTSMVRNSVKTSIDSSLIKLTGTNTEGNKITVYDEAGHIIKQVGRPTQGKTDILLPNVKIQISGHNNQYEGEIDIDIGISNKAYVSNFGGNNIKNNTSQIYSLGSGGSLRYAIEDLYKVPFDRYLAYNVFAHQDESDLQNVLEKIYDLILTRELIRIASSRSHKEFSQFIVANGKVVSIWELIMSTKNFVGKTSSQNENQPIALSIPYENRKDIINSAKEENMMLRIQHTNNAIHNTPIQGKLHLNKLITLQT